MLCFVFLFFRTPVGFGARLCPQAAGLFLLQERAELPGRHHAREQEKERGRQEKESSGEAGKLKAQTVTCNYV